jgi:hypothetical protein
MVPKAAVIALNFELEQVHVDFFEPTPAYPDPSVLAEAFMQSVRDDWPGWSFTVWKNPAAVELFIDRVLGR